MEEYTVYAIIDGITLKKVAETEEYGEAEEYFHKGYIVDEYYIRKIKITHSTYAQISIITNGKADWV